LAADAPPAICPLSLPRIEDRYLDGTWKVSGAGMTFAGKVPGDLLTDMQAAGIIGDPL